MFSILFFLVAGFIPMYFVLSSKINDGIIIKIGLMMMSIGFLGAAGASYEDCDLLNPCITSIVGFFIVFGGVALRIGSEKFKRITDWLHVEKPNPRIERRGN